MKALEWRRDGYVISTDPDRLDREMIVDFLAASYWGSAVDHAVLARSLEHCVPFGLYKDSSEQIGFAKVITDFTRFAWLGDVFILEDYRGQGLALWLNQTIRDCELFRDVGRWVLRTRDAHPLYRKLGYETLADPEEWMVLDRKP